MKSTRMRLLIGAALAVALLLAVLWGLDLRAIGATMAAANPGWLLAAVAVTLLAYWLRAWRWGALLAPLRQVPVSDLTRATLIGFAASLVVPRSGELLRPWLVSRRHPVDASAAFATIVVERVIDLVCVLAMFALYLHALPRPAGESGSRWMGLLQTAGIGAAGVALALLVLLWGMHAYTDAAGRRLGTLLTRLPERLARRIAGIARGFAGGLAVMRAPWPHHGFIGLQSALMWLATVAAFDAVHRALGLELPFQMTLLLTAFLVVGESIPTPGLIGGFHAFYVLCLVEVYGVPRETAMAAAVLAHAVTNGPVLLIGALLAAREGIGWRGLSAASRGPD